MSKILNYTLFFSEMRQETFTMLQGFWKKIKCKKPNQAGNFTNSQSTEEANV